MSEAYVHVDGQPPKTREDLNNYIQASGHIVAKLEIDIYKRERKRQAVSNLLNKNPEKKYFNETEIQKELNFLEDNNIDYEWDQND